MSKCHMKLDKKNSNLLNLMIFSKLKLICFLVLNIVFSLLSLYGAVLYGDLLDIVVKEDTSYALLLQKIYLIVFYIVFLSILSTLLINLQGRYLANSIYNVRNKLVSSLLNSKYETIKKEQVGNYLSELTIDVPNITSISLGTVVGLLSNIIIIVGSLIIIGLANPKILLTILGLSFLIGLLPLIIKKPLDKNTSEISSRNQNYIKILKEVLSSVLIIKTFGAETECLDYTIDENKKLFEQQKFNYLLTSLSSGWGIFMKEIIGIIVLSYTCYLVYKKELGVGMILTMYTLSNRFFGSLISCVGNITNFIGHKTVFERIEKRIDTNEDNCNKLKITFNDKIQINDLSFCYEKDKLVIDTLNFEFVKGKKYLLVGKSGCGKSTFLKIIANLYTNYCGSILIDNKDAQISQTNDFITYCGQEPFLFTRTIKENIIFNSQYDSTKLKQCIKLSELDSFVALRKEGIESIIDEEINQISGGEKFRINLARALYKDNEILLLDEVTSALDIKTAKKVESNLLELNKTVISVCHKYNKENLKKYDKILIMGEGKIISHGSYSEMMLSDTFKDFEINDNENKD